jgi:hypothetical protein
MGESRKLVDSITFQRPASRPQPLPLRWALSKGPPRDDFLQLSVFIGSPLRAISLQPKCRPIYTGPHEIPSYLHLRISRFANSRRHRDKPETPRAPAATPSVPHLDRRQRRHASRRTQTSQQPTRHDPRRHYEFLRTPRRPECSPIASRPRSPICRNRVRQNRC